MWGGVVAAVAVSLTVGVVVRATVGELDGAARLHAFAGDLGAGRRRADLDDLLDATPGRLVKGDLEHRVDTALRAENIGLALAGVALVAVLREGIEAALLLLAAGTDQSGGAVLVGALIGLVLASVLAYAVYWGGRSIPMRAFFKVTGLVLIVFAAGLVAKTVMFLQVSGDIGSLSLNGVYDLTSYRWLTQETEVGKFLSAMFGWDPRPSLEQVVAWVAFLVPVTILFLRPAPAPRPVVTPTP